MEYTDEVQTAELPADIRIRGLSFRYRKSRNKALDDIDLEIPAGQMVMVMGRSNAGKSTLAGSLNGLVPLFFSGEFSGTVSVAGAIPRQNGVNAMARHMGLVFQEFETQLFSTRAELEVAFGLERRGLSRAAMQDLVAGLFASVGLKGYESFAPAELSGGQKQRLALAAVLATDPAALCLDEPTTDLDPAGKREVFALLRGMRTDARGAKTVVVIEHETEECLWADRIVMMEQGRIVADGEASMILKDVALFGRLGLMPLPTCAYFDRLGIGREALPLTVDAAAGLFASAGLGIDGSGVQRCLAADAERRAAYGDEAIRVESLYCTFDGKPALNGINLRIDQREFVAVLGANGSGKTTLAKHLNGLLRPERGKVFLQGRDTSGLSVFELGRTVGYVFQNPDHQIFCDTVREEVAFALELRGISPDETERRVARSLAAVGLTGFEGEDPFSLSKGQRQRVALASVLAMEAQVLILDEPTTGLDYRDQKQMMELVKQLNSAGHTILMITHTVWVAAEYAHRVLLMRDGQVIADGGVREILSDAELLAKTDVLPPQITQLGCRIGFPALSVQELLDCTLRVAGEVRP